MRPDTIEGARECSGERARVFEVSDRDANTALGKVSLLLAQEDTYLIAITGPSMTEEGDWYFTAVLG